MNTHKSVWSREKLLSDKGRVSALWGPWTGGDAHSEGMGPDSVRVITLLRTRSNLMHMN